MPRTGRHPLKGVVEAPKMTNKLTITTIVYIPTLSGYWQESLEIFQLFIDSLYKNTIQPFDLMVFDNGSCSEVQEYLLNLRNSGRIQFLILSQFNLGKTGALSILLTTASGDFVTYADSDLFFLPGWLDNTLNIFNTFPKAGKVTALPIVMNTSSEIFEKIFSNALVDATKDPSITIEAGVLVPEDLLNAHRLSLGETIEQYQTRIQKRKDLLLRKDNCEVLISGADHQFTIKRSAIDSILPLKNEHPEVKGDAIYTPILEHRLAEAGYWQLSTPGYYVHHMGNHVPDFRNELPWLSQESFVSSLDYGTSLLAKTLRIQNRSFLYRLFRLNFLRKILKKIHLYTYRLLYE